MSELATQGVAVRFVRSSDTGYRPTLEKVTIESDHPLGPGVVHLSDDQALYTHSRLSAISSAFLHGRPNSVRNFGVERLPEDHEQHLSRSGAKVWPIYCEAEDHSVVLTEIVIESDHPDGQGLIHLTPEQARYVLDRLTDIALGYLHDYGWGGEDALTQ